MRRSRLSITGSRGWPMGFSGDAGESPDAYGSFPSFDFRDLETALPTRAAISRTAFLSAASATPWASAALVRARSAVSGSIYSEGTQFGYSLKNGGGPPVTFFAGFDTLKYNTGIGGLFAPFDSKSGTLPVSSAYAGVEFQLTSNLSLSLGVGVCPAVGPNRQRDQFAARRLAVRHPSLTRGPQFPGMCRRRDPARQSWPLDCIRTG